MRVTKKMHSDTKSHSKKTTQQELNKNDQVNFTRECKAVIDSSEPSASCCHSAGYKTKQRKKVNLASLQQNRNSYSFAQADP